MMVGGDSEGVRDGEWWFASFSYRLSMKWEHEYISIN